MIAEKAVLGSIVKEPYLLQETDLQPIHLTGSQNKALLTAMRNLEREGKSVDMITLLSSGSPDSWGAAAYLQEVQAAANPKKFDEHVDLVMDHWREREKQNLLNMASHENWSIDKVKSELDRLIDDKTSDYQPINSLLGSVYEAPWIKVEKQSGVPSGIEQVDKLVGGWQKSDLIILAARPSMGKTDVMLSFAKHAGWHDFLPIVFSLEMAAERLRDRLLGSIGMYNRGKFKNLERFLTVEEKNRWTAVVGKADNTNLQIFDRAGQTLSEMRMKIRKAMSEFPGKRPVIFIDYLTLIKPADHMGGNMHLQVSATSKGLKEIAKEFECPVICLAQLSRQVEQRQDKRPMLSDLRESGSIEEDADVVLFLYRDSYYSKNDDDKVLEMIFAKHRNGATGTVMTYYDKTTGVMTG
ncbi:replicative DNA helicase [Sporosarcina highlanderae]|uniref:DNA 5'-3' helicase n=1 Tax=Sporosarcina highlanderae TaxID=3035916 RepID=A0ABT8JVF4_9BACL|nr:DnaB-like helicase C-terminal domain-containing protein [Sporosarcina highlanderae]MDN4609153.1 DnaB-like helicase C-terminal domain-containing protein [Sporosarcina highlanderae]